VQQRGELGVQIADLGAQRQGQAGFGSDVLGQVGIADLAVPQLQGPGRGGQDAAGLLFAP
jgi:hypothetical protein